MKLQTSYFNTTVLKKNLTRFAPVWVLYAIFWLIILSTNLVQKNYITNLGNWLDLSSFMGAFNMLYAGLCALVLFSDLWNTRICNALHAMPMRREGWLLTHSISALLFALIPYVIAFSYTLALLPTHWDLALIWLGISLVQFIFFFGLAAFCSLCAAECTGSVAVGCIVCEQVWNLAAAVINGIRCAAAIVTDMIFIICCIGMKQEHIDG